MPSPVRPSDFLDAVPSSSAGICEKFVKSFLRLPVLMYKLVNWMFNADGTFSDAAKTELGGGSTSGTATTALAAPTNVSASETLTDRVTVTWSPVSGASYYQVFRGSSSDSTLLGDPIASPNVTTYDDTSAVLGTHYFYFVKAFTSANVPSPFSTGDEGFSKAAALDAETFGPGITTRTVPVGWTTIDISAYAAGGSGGGSNYSPFTVGTPSYYGGGGGGSGEKRVRTAIAVTAGQELVINVGLHGICPPFNSGGQPYPGGNGYNTKVSRSGTDLILAVGGTGGGIGNDVGNTGTVGIGGSGGTGGSSTPGNNGSVGGGPSSSPAGGAGGAANDGYGAGGAGGAGSQLGIPNASTVLTNPSTYDGRVIIQPYA